MPLAIILSVNPKVISANDPSLGTSVISNERPLTILFDRPFDEDKIKYQITPSLDGDWELKSNLFINNSSIVFTPTETAELDTRYTISLNGINSLLNSQDNDFLFSFQTPSVPNILSSSVVDGAENILPNTDIVIECDPIIDKTADFVFELTPSAEFDTIHSDSTYTIKPTSPLSKGTAYVLTAYRSLYNYNYKTQISTITEERKEVYSISFSTMAAPGIKSVSPQGSGVLTDTSIDIIFSQAMDRTSVEEAFIISPQVNGNFSWSSDTDFTFKPYADLNKNSRYNITISTSAKAADGSNLEEEIAFQFITIGYVTVLNFSPTNGSSNIDTSANIVITFNQAVDHSSAERSFSISPEVSGDFSWNNNQMQFNHTALSQNQRYTLNLAAGITSIYGLDSKDAFSAAFTTKIPSYSINVSAYHQAHMYSCMASAARSALAYKGVSLSEDTILKRIGYDSTSWSGTWNEAGSVWGDPNIGIVGSVDGKADNIGWGYGAHWSPVASAINSFGRSSEVKSGWDVSGIASEISAGNPVIIWWVNGVWPAYVVNWNTPDGKQIRAVNSMHVQVVKGFSGSVEDPQSFTVTDSGYGYPGRTYDVGTFKAKWSWFSNTAVVVR